MKRLLATVLIAMILFVNVGVAEGIDLSSYDNEDLTKLYDAIEEEMINRGVLRSGTLPGGYYTVGVDIAEGMYDIFSEGYFMGTFFIFQSEDLCNRYIELEKDMGGNVSLSWDIMHEEEGERIDLKNGQVLFSNNSIKLVEVKNSLMP